MATVFIILVLAVLLVNSLKQKSDSQWWRDVRGALKGTEDDYVPPVDDSAGQAGPFGAPVHPADLPRRVAGADSGAFRPAPAAYTGPGPGPRPENAATDVFARIPADDEAPTQFMARVADGAPAHR